MWHYISLSFSLVLLINRDKVYVEVLDSALIEVFFSRIILARVALGHEVLITQT